MAKWTPKDVTAKGAGKFGKAIGATRAYKLNKKELDLEKLKTASKLGGVKYGINKAADVAKTLIAAQTAKEISKPGNSSLNTWLASMGGNPDKETGSEGDTQNRSTSELGG